MSEAPEKLKLHYSKSFGVWKQSYAVDDEGCTEYIRSDIAEQREQALQAKYDKLLKALKDEGYEIGVVDGPELGE